MLEQSSPLTTPLLTADFDFGPKDLARWIGSNLASGIVGAMGGLAFGEALKAIGLGDTVPEALLDISRRLAAVEQSVAEIKAVVNEILRELQAMKISMEQYFGEGQLAQAFINIDDAYDARDTLRGAAPGAIVAPSLMTLLTTLPKTKTPAQLKLYADAFVQAEGLQWKITTQITTIHNALTQTVGHGTTLLQRWADGLILAIEQKKITYPNAYLTLEGYFLQAVAKQLLGVAIHCFALGEDEAFIQDFVQSSFGTKMRAQTREFLHQTERLTFSQVRLKKVPSTFTQQQSGEFPDSTEATFLRADLLCAALDLVGNTTSAASPKQAIAGIYGRVLARASDPLSIPVTLPGFAASTGTRAKAIPSLHPVDLSRQQDTLTLGSYTDSSPVIIRYFWRWPTTPPTQGQPIDPTYRGSVIPAVYNIFGNTDGPLAAGFVDFSRMLLGAPADMPSRLTENSPLPLGDPHTTLHQSPFVPTPIHLLTRATPHNPPIGWRIEHAWRSTGTRNRTIAFYLFNYTGAKARIRFHVNCTCRVEHYKGSRQAGDDDINARLSIRRTNGEKITFYNTHDEGGGVLNLIQRASDYKRSVESWKQVEVELEPGEYSLVLDLQSKMQVEGFFEGWCNDELIFQLLGIYTEWV